MNLTNDLWFCLLVICLFIDTVTNKPLQREKADESDSINEEELAKKYVFKSVNMTNYKVIIKVYTKPNNENTSFNIKDTKFQKTKTKIEKVTLCF